MSVKRKDQQNLVILNMMRERQCLWNPKLTEYKEKSKRDKALEDIVQELNLSILTVERLKLKIKSIRTRYSTELVMIRKSERSGAGTDDICVPKLFWFAEADNFLRTVCVPRSSSETRRAVLSL